MSTAPHIIQLEQRMADAILANDADAIDAFLHDDWVLVDSTGRVLSRAEFLNVIRSGDLSHDLMQFADWRVRVHGGCAVATCEARSGGIWQGEPFQTHERSTSVYAQLDGEWTCVLTQLTNIAPGT